MTELQFKVASLIPTLLNGYSGLRQGIPEGEGGDRPNSLM